MHRASRSRWFLVPLLVGACLLPTPASAHPGTGIVIDRLGQIYFVDMVAGVWKIDVHGALTRLPGPGFHWLALDASDRFAAVQLPSGAAGDIERIGVNPTLLLASDFPIALGIDGNLYYPTHSVGSPLQILKMLSTGQTSILASLSGTTAGGPLRDLNGLAAGPDGSLYYTENAAIRRISKEGRVSTIAENIAPTGCKKNDPLLRGLDVDAAGNIYVAATACAGVLKVTPAGQVSVLPQIQNPWSPTGVALFGNNVYVLEFQNAESDDRREMLPRVRKITADGKTVIVATVSHH
jgi:hypothetical protein